MRWNGVSHFEFDGNSMETEATTWLEFPNGGKAIVEQILASEKTNKSKRARMWQPQSGIQVGMLTVWVRLSDIKNYNRIHQVYHFHQNRLSSTYDGRCLWKTHLCWMKQRQKLRIKTKKVINGGRRSKTLNEVKPVENINKKPQTFLEMSCKRKSFFHITWKTMHMNRRIFPLTEKRFFSHTEQECHESLFQRKIHIQRH